jgi:hypothetical protein
VSELRRGARGEGRGARGAGRGARGEGRGARGAGDREGVGEHDVQQVAHKEVPRRRADEVVLDHALGVAHQPARLKNHA